MDFKAKPTAPKTINTDSDNTLVTKDYVDVEVGKLPTTDTTYTAGTNISIDANNKISAIDTTYIAGTNVSIVNRIISATDTIYDDTQIQADLLNKVNKVSGKDLSTNDYTNADKTKVTAIPANPKYTDTTYTAGTNMSINNNVISAELKDSGTSTDWLDAKYKIKIINGKPYLEVVDV